MPFASPMDLNHLVCDLNLLKKQAELLGSRLKGLNLLHQDSKICFFCNHQNEFKEFFCQENALVFCNNACCVIEALGHEHDPTEWRLCVDSSEVSSKYVLLHNGD